MFQRQIADLPKGNRSADHGPGEDADTVARDAVHGRAEDLAPADGDIALMQTGQRVAAAEHIQENSERSAKSVIRTKPHLRTGFSGVERMSTATKATDSAVSRTTEA